MPKPVSPSLQRALDGIERKLKNIKNPTEADLPRLAVVEERVKRIDVLRGNLPAGKRGPLGRSISRVIFMIIRLRTKALGMEPQPL